MARLRFNGLVGALSGSHSNSVTTLTLAAKLTYNGGTDVPTIASPDYLPMAVLDSTGALAEIVYITAYTTAGTSATITRGKEGTSGVSHADGDLVVNAATILDWQGRDINAQTGTSYTLVLADAFEFVTMANAAASVLTVPPNSSVPFPIGTEIPGAQLGAGQLTLTPGAGVTINGDPGLKIAAQYGAFALKKVGTDTWLAVGRLAS